MSNVAPDATGLISPEIAEEKLKVVTQENEEAKLNVAVVVGTTQETTSARIVEKDGIMEEVH